MAFPPMVTCARFLSVTSHPRSKGNRLTFHSRRVAGCSPNTGRLHLPRKSTPTVLICSETLAKLLIIAAVADTHTALWQLFDDARLSGAAGTFISEAAATRRKIAISTISLAEVVYLIEKNRLPPSAYDELADPEHVFTEAVFTSAIVQAMRDVSRAEVPDMPDRVVAATAIYFDVPVISRDKRIRAARLKTIW